MTIESTVAALSKQVQVFTQTIQALTSWVHMFECSYLAHGTTHPLGQIQVDFPHYDDLDQIWQGIPGFDSDLISSNPTVDHAQNLLSLVQTKPVEKHTPPAEVHAQEEGNTNNNG